VIGKLKLIDKKGLKLHLWSGKMSYIRDGRAPVPDSETTSRTMSAIRAKNTKPELGLRKALRAVGIPGYRLHWKKAPGRPDIAFPGRKVAIFVHGCFWHRCPICNLSLPKSHTDWWNQKLERNKLRDEEKVHALETAGWTVLVFWEHDIRADAIGGAKKVKAILNKK
jgi:DNA mismatch endonuclease (patch repair protein)